MSDPIEMQAIIDDMCRDLHTLVAIATEPGIDPVHPQGTIDRRDDPVSHHSTDVEVDAVLAEF
jgi:hypothetical protein